MNNRRLSLGLALGFAIAATVVSLPARQSALNVSQNLFAEMRWRNIGPFHGGRISAISGAIGEGQAGVFYAGAPIGGLWKTTSGGVTWFQIFDQFKNVDSIGAVQVAPSDPVRIAMTGKGSGPSLYHLMEVLGRERVLQRLDSLLSRF